ncbi:MAG TPA: DUF4386 domain-containing protein [Gemmatimonadaceae bacterium]|nr:DUF4386 domain-containing protein [Gemmatimonadaceae bacterium]
MSTMAVTGRVAEVSPRVKARIAGVLYLIIIVGGIFAQIGVRGRLVVNGDAAATAQNIIAHELLYRLGFAVEVFTLLCNIPINIILYDLFKVVNKKMAMVLLFFATVGTAVEGVSVLAHYAPLVLLGKGSYLAAFTTAQLQAASYMSLQMFDYGFMIALSFFGFFCISLSYLIFRSTFFPRVIGGLLAIQGTLYLTNSFAHFVSPPVGDRVFPFLALSGIAEVSFCLWLLVVGLNVQRWKEQAGQSM